MISDDPILKAFGQSVARHRQKKSYSQETLAEKAALNRTYIGDIERGSRNPGIRNVVLIARALDVSTAALFQEAGL